MRGDRGCRMGTILGRSPFPPASLSGAVLVVDWAPALCAVAQQAANAAAAGAIGVVGVMPPGARAVLQADKRFNLYLWLRSLTDLRLSSVGCWRLAQAWR